MSKHKQVFAFIIALVIGAGVIIAVPTWRGKPWRLKKGLDLAGGVRVVLQAETDKLPEGEEWTNEHLSSIVRIIRNRVDIQGVSEPLIQTQPPDRVVVELPDIKNEEEAISQLKSTARMEFRHFYNVHYYGAKRYRPAAAKYTMEITTDEKGDHFDFTDTDGETVKPEQVLAESKLILTGDALEPASVATKDPQTYRMVVRLKFTREGRKKFADFTRRNVDEILAIVLDERILSAPTIDEPILDGEAIIRGRFDAQEAQTLAEFLNAGALPVPLTVAQVQSVEATLGQDSVSKSTTAGIGGLIAVVAFMVLYYLLPGLIADLALGIYAVLTLAVFKLLGVTLTLPGIAAYIVSIGMAVDASILIFERLKEELRSGKTLRAAIDTGFARAFTSIFDSNVCTLITCAILWNFGTGPIKGFALVLGLGVLVSMFTAITVTRTILHLIVNTEFAQNPGLFGLGRQWVTGETGRQVDVVGRMWIWFALSAVIILPGLYYWIGGHGLKSGIDFTGGSLTQVEFKQPVQQTAAIDEVLTSAGLTGNMVQRSRDDPKTVFIRTKHVSEEKFRDIRIGLQNMGGTIQQSERVGPTISKELSANAIKAIIFASLAIILYLSVRFAIGGLANGFRFGTCAVLATTHDVAVIIGIFAVLGFFLGWEIDSLFVTALLTIIGFSTHDTIVIFDRIRENLRHRAKGEAFGDLVNRSILQSFARSINTSLTVVLTLVALMAFGAYNIRHFVVALLIGVITGTYSSIFNASQLLVLWQRLTEKEPLMGRSAIEPADSRVAKVRELKPIAGESVSPDADVEAETGLSPKRESRAGGRKVKAKKRKRRF